MRGQVHLLLLSPKSKEKKTLPRAISRLNQNSGACITNVVGLGCSETDARKGHWENRAQDTKAHQRCFIVTYALRSGLIVNERGTSPKKAKEYMHNLFLILL